MASTTAGAVRDLTGWRVLPRSRRARCQSATRRSTARPRPESHRGATTTRTSHGSRRSGARGAMRRARRPVRTGRRRIRIGRCRRGRLVERERPRDLFCVPRPFCLKGEIGLGVSRATALGLLNGMAPDFPGCSGYGRICSMWAERFFRPTLQRFLGVWMERNAASRHNSRAEEWFSACSGCCPRAPRETTKVKAPGVQIPRLAALARDDTDAKGSESATLTPGTDFILHPRIPAR